MQTLQDKKLRGQLAVREELYGKSAKDSAKIEKVISVSLFHPFLFSMFFFMRFVFSCSV